MEAMVGLLENDARQEDNLTTLRMGGSFTKKVRLPEKIDACNFLINSN